MAPQNEVPQSHDIQVVGAIEEPVAFAEDDGRVGGAGAEFDSAQTFTEIVVVDDGVVVAAEVVAVVVRPGVVRLHRPVVAHGAAKRQAQAFVLAEGVGSIPHFTEDPPRVVVLMGCQVKVIQLPGDARGLEEPYVAELGPRFRS